MTALAALIGLVVYRATRRRQARRWWHAEARAAVYDRREDPQ